MTPGILPSTRMGTVEIKNNSSISFLQSLLAVLPFTKANRDLRNTLENVNRQSFYDDESKRVRELNNLVKEGQHGKALAILLAETDVENPLQYFNKIRYNGNPQVGIDFQPCSLAQKVEEKVRETK